MPEVVAITPNQHAIGAIVQVFILVIAVFGMERHLRRVEHRPLSLVRNVKGCIPWNEYGQL
jgi:hypothetical protein